jgi:predicted secreted protein
MNRVSHRLFYSGLVIALALQLVTSGIARAQETAPPDEQVKARLAFITGALDAGQSRAKTWWYGWIAGYSAGAVAMGVLAATNWNEPVIETFAPVPEPNRSFAQDMLVGSATFALGVAGLLIDPFVPATAARKLRPLPETTSMERLAKLQRAEELLRQCARREKDGRSMKTHLMNIGVNAAAGVVTAAAFKRPWTDGLITFVTGEAVSLLTIFSQPMRATRDLKKYEAGDLGNSGVSTPERRWSLGVWPGGLSFRLQF